MAKTKQAARKPANTIGNSPLKSLASKAASKEKCPNWNWNKKAKKI